MVRMDTIKCQTSLGNTAIEEESEGENDSKDEGNRTSPSCRGVSIEVPPLNSSEIPPPLNQATPVAALRRYLDTMPQHPSIITELKSKSVWRSLKSELVASFLLTVVSSAASIRPATNPFNHPRMLSFSSKDYSLDNENQDSLGFGWGAEWAIGHGLTLGALTWAIRSAHFSLPTTLALVVSRKISVLRALLHSMAQILGAIIAIPILFGLLPRPPRAPSLATSLSAAQGWGAEFLANALVSLISLSSYECLDNNSRSTNGEDSLTPRIASGALLPLVAAHTSAALFTAGFTGVGLNPARSLALATITEKWDYHWVWWVGPAMGGIFAAFTHQFTGARDPRTAVPTIGATPRPSIVPRDGSRPSFMSSTPASPIY